MRIWWALLFLPVFCLVAGCNTNRLEVDVSGVDVEIKANRFEQDLFAIAPDSLANKHAALLEKHGLFYQLYVERVLNIGHVKDPAIGIALKSFVTDADIQSIYKESREHFSDLEAVNTGLTNAFRHFKYYFPGSEVPVIYTFVSGMEYQNFVAENVMGIGLDMYLGNGYRYYGTKGFPVYKQKNMRDEYIVSDAMKNWLASRFERNDEKSTMLSHIVYHGKLLYLMGAMMPDVHDTIIIGYTKKQLDWCFENEFHIWAHFVDNELLYTAESNEIQKYTGEGPFTSGFHEGAPAQMGYWLGWQIVRSFMEEHPEISVSELAGMNNARAILNKSGYKPR